MVKYLLEKGYVKSLHCACGVCICVYVYVYMRMYMCMIGMYVYLYVNVYVCVECTCTAVCACGCGCASVVTILHPSETKESIICLSFFVVPSSELWRVTQWVACVCYFAHTV